MTPNSEIWDELISFKFTNGELLLILICLYATFKGPDSFDMSRKDEALDLIKRMEHLLDQKGLIEKGFLDALTDLWESSKN